MEAHNIYLFILIYNYKLWILSFITWAFDNNNKDLAITIHNSICYIQSIVTDLLLITFTFIGTHCLTFCLLIKYRLTVETSLYIKNYIQKKNQLS